MISWNEIKKACPNLYRKKVNFQCRAGWSDIIFNLSKKLESLICDKPEIYATEIKERYGSLRFSLSQETDEINALIDDAEIKSAKTCEECGEDGNIYWSGWFKVRCKKCIQKVLDET